MHKERIIAGIEKVFEGYAQDEELRGALRSNGSWIPLFDEYNRRDYLLAENGNIFVLYNDICSHVISSLRFAAQDYFKYLQFKHIHPLTLTKAKAILAEDLGARVEKLKRDYARHFDNECDRQAEGRYVQHPDI